MSREKENNDMRKFIDFWVQSKKYKKLREKLENLRNEMIEVHNLDREQLLNYVKENNFGIKKLNEILDDYITILYYSDEEKQELCIEHLVNKGVTVKELLTELTRNLIKWYTYLYTYEKAEAYELCAKIKQVIDLEIKDFLFNLSVYGEEIGDYVQVIDELNEKIQKKLWPNY